MQASLELLQSCGIENIFSESVRLAALLENGLKDNYQIITNGPGKRLSVHAYNLDSEIERVLNLLG